MIQVGSIVSNLVAGESVVINKIEKLGSHYSLEYRGVNSQAYSTKVISQTLFDGLVEVTSSSSILREILRSLFCSQRLKESIQHISLILCLL